MDWNRLLSRVRLGRPPSALATAQDVRTEFQRDFDRIVFSPALRRLQDKTQVFPLARNDYVRTRLTHSLEAASVGRSLGVMVGADVIARHRLGDYHPQDVGAVVAAACLAHDIGNPPFGHAGEDAIRLWFRESATAARALEQLDPARREDLLRFEGNAQGFRLLTRLQNPDNPGGMQLSCATLGAFSKYPWPSWPYAETAKFGFFQADRSLFADVATTLGLTPLGSELDHSWRRHPLAYLVEAADDICYLIIDVEDAARLRRLSFADAFELLAPLVATPDRDRALALGDQEQRLELLRAKAIGYLIDQVHGCFMDLEGDILAGRFDAELLARIPAAAALSAIKTSAVKHIYYAPEVVQVGTAGFRVLAGLLEAFVAAMRERAERGEAASSRSRMLLHLLPSAGAEPPADDPYPQLLAVTDFVAGMTDSYALSLYRKITGISLPQTAL